MNLKEDYKKLLRRQVNQIRVGGWSVAVRKSVTLTAYVTAAFWALPFLMLTRLLRPIFLVRFGRFNHVRIGHFVSDVGQRKAEATIAPSTKRLNLWYLPKSDECCNTYWALVTRRWLSVHSWVRYLIFWNNVLPLSTAHVVKPTETGSRDTAGFLDMAQLTLPSTEEEENEARKWLAQFGWKEGDKFVCLMVRDSTYLDKNFPHRKWDYHSYRDSDIKTYVMAIDFLTSQGVYVFRMGKQMGQRLEYAHPRFIDYAFLNVRSDFLDVWLFANCTFCITTGTGPDMISDVFRRPILALNFLPLQDSWSWSNALHFPKILRSADTGYTLTLEDYLSARYHWSKGYEDAGISISNLSDLDIYLATREAADIFLNPSSAQTESREHEFALRIFKQHVDFRAWNKFVHPGFRFSQFFLSSLDGLSDRGR